MRNSATFLTIYQIPVGYKSNSVITAGLPYEVQKFAQSFVNQTYTGQKKKRNSKIFPLCIPFNAKMLIVIKYLVLVKFCQNLSVA